MELQLKLDFILNCVPSIFRDWQGVIKEQISQVAPSHLKMPLLGGLLDNLEGHKIVCNVGGCL